MMNMKNFQVLKKNLNYMEVFNFFFQDSPKVTTFLTLTCLSISVLTWFEILSPLYLYLNFELIFKKYQFWRLFTSFFY